MKEIETIKVVNFVETLPSVTIIKAKPKQFTPVKTPNTTIINPKKMFR